MSCDRVLFLCAETVASLRKIGFTVHSAEVLKGNGSGALTWMTRFPHSCYCVSSKPNYKHLIKLMAYSRIGRLTAFPKSLSCDWVFACPNCRSSAYVLPVLTAQRGVYGLFSITFLVIFMKVKIFPKYCRIYSCPLPIERVLLYSA
jgi:hypothetical protein